MKFSTSYEATVRENAFLRSLAKNLILVVISALTIVFLSYDRTPMMVESTAHGMEIIHPTELKNGEEDVKTAITLQIKARFDSDVRSPEVFLAPKQLLLRDAEQKELKSHGMTQTVIVRKIAITKNDATVDFDRLISVAEVRSAFKAQVKVSFEEIEPNEMNPYGLILSLAEPIQPKPEERK